MFTFPIHGFELLEQDSFSSLLCGAFCGHFDIEKDDDDPSTRKFRPLQGV